jgi:putative FmdB family regulatory protein
MPIYEYRCASCGHELEALQKLSEAPLRECPACQKLELKKKVSAAGFHLKGSGWYVTDFRNSGAKPAAKDNAAKPDAKTGNGEAKPETKTADTTATESTTTSTKTTSSDGATESKSTTTTSSDKTAD